MQRRILATSLILALLGGIYGATLLTRTERPLEQITTIREPLPPKAVNQIPDVATLHDLVNIERTTAGLTPLTLDERLNSSAMKMAQDMVTNGYYGHENPKTGRHGYEYIKEATDYTCSYVSENLNANVIQGYTSSDIIRTWMSSKSHRDAILDYRYDLVGYAVSGDYVVQHFCNLD